MSTAAYITTHRSDVLPLTEASTTFEGSSALRKIARAVGETLSSMGYLAFAAGMIVIACTLIPFSMGAATAATFTYPAYLAIAGGSGLLTGELCKNFSERQVINLSFAA